MTRETATIVVIGILPARLKSFHTEALRHQRPTPLPKKMVARTGKRRVICARNMPWTMAGLTNLEWVVTIMPPNPPGSSRSRTRLLEYLLAMRRLRAVRRRWHKTVPASPPSRHAPVYPDHAQLMVVRDGHGREQRNPDTWRTGTSGATTSWLISRKSPGSCPAASAGFRSTSR